MYQKVDTNLNFVQREKKTKKFLASHKELGKPWFGQLMAGPQLMAYFIQINDWMDHNKADNLFRFLLLKRCNQLAESLPGLFEVAGDASEFFLRLGFVEKDGFVYKLVHDIEEDDWKDQVQIIGWMYQHYIAEKHDEIVNVY